MAGQCPGDDHPAVSGCTGYAEHLTGGPEVLGGPAGHPRCPAPLESDAGASSPRHCLVTGGGLTADGAWQAVRNGFLLPARVVMAVFRGKMLDALRRAFARDALGLPEAMPLNSFLIFSTVSAIRRRRAGMSTSWNAMPTGPGGDVSGPLSAGWPAQERPPRGVRRRLRHLHLSCAAGGGRRGARLSPTEDVARGGLSATVAPPCPGAPEARRAVLRAGSSYARRGLDHLPHGVGTTAAGGPTSPGLADRVAQRGDAHPERCPPCGQRLVCTSVIPRGGAPPPVRAGALAA